MLNHMMKPKDILREFWTDLDRATYWMNRKSGGEMGRGKNFARLMYGIYCGAQEKRSEIFTYDSPKTGNHWMMWDRASMGRNGMEPASYRVCYQMTEQYMCVMVPTTLAMESAEKPLSGVTIYTPHMFQRMHERAGIDMSDRLLTIRNFCEHLVESLMDHREPRGNEKHDQIVCRLPGSWLRGHFVMVGDEYVIKYRTFYTDSTLTPYQRKELKSFRKMADRVKSSGDFEQYKRDIKRNIKD